MSIEEIMRAAASIIGQSNPFGAGPYEKSQQQQQATWRQVHDGASDPSAISFRKRADGVWVMPE